jgi:YD repeat-containing protein
LSTSYAVCRANRNSRTITATFFSAFSPADRVGRVRAFGYDPAGRKESEAWLAGGTTVQLQTWGHDDAGRLTEAADPDGTYILDYDEADRVTRVDGPFGMVLTLGYDKAGNRDRVALPAW